MLSEHLPSGVIHQFNTKGMKFSLDTTSQANDDGSSTNNFTPGCFVNKQTAHATPLQSNKALILSHLNNSFDSSEGNVIAKDLEAEGKK